MCLSLLRPYFRGFCSPLLAKGGDLKLGHLNILIKIILFYNLVTNFNVGIQLLSCKDEAVEWIINKSGNLL